MKKLFYSIVLLVLIAVFVFFFVGGKIVDGQNNVLEKHNYGDIPADIKTLHESLIIADWHSDNLLWDRNPLTELTHGHVDIPRLIKGNVTLQVFDAVIKSPKGQNYLKNSDDSDMITILAMANRWPVKTWSSLYQRAIHQSKILHTAASHSEGKLRIIKTHGELSSLLQTRVENKETVGGLLAIEGLHALEGNIENLDVLYDSGFRLMGLTHFFDNEVGGSSAGEEQGGLTTFGKVVIDKMNQKGIIIDLAHASPALIDDVLDRTSKPIVVSHTGVKGTYDSPRNLSDDHLRKIAANGGLVGIGFWNGAVGSSEPEDIVRAMRYVTDLIGINYVSLGSDWDGGTTIAFDAAHLWVLTKALKEGGFTEGEIKKIMGENQIRFLLENLPE